MSAESILGIVVLAALFSLEGALPFYLREGGRYRHATQNLTLALIAGATGAAMAPLLVLTSRLAADSGFGLCHVADASAIACGLVTFVLFDLWMYAWHRANHRIPFLWRFHRVHHTDPAMDSTTALRFHPGEIVFSTLLNCLVIAALGMSLAQLAVYKTVMVAVILFHHSNIRLPDSADLALRGLIVPPSMHRVHHSHLREETDSNYGTVLSFWDRLFGSFRTRSSYRDIRFGIGSYETAAWQRPLRLLTLPLQPLTARPGLGASSADGEQPR